LDAALENGPPANPFDCPNNCELRFPMGVDRFTLFSTLRAFTLRVRL
jgi:hypothetical protein